MFSPAEILAAIKVPHALAAATNTAQVGNPDHAAQRDGQHLHVSSL